jgi:hypothetical protein
MFSAQGYLSQFLIDVYTQESIGDLTALALGIRKIDGSSLKFGCFKALHESTLLSGTVIMHLSARCAAIRIITSGTKVSIDFPKWKTWGDGPRFMAFL